MYGNIKKILTIGLCAFCLIIIPLTTRAAAVGLPCTPTQGSGTANNTDLFTCVNNLYKYALVISAIAAVLMIILAGYMYIFSGGSTSKVGTAKSWIASSLLGIAVLLTGFLLLKQINPSLLTIKNISPQQIAQQAWATLQDDDWNPGGGNIGGQGIPGNNSGPSGHSANELQCGFQGNKANYVQYMTEALFQAVKQVCAEVKAKGLTANISSISTGHIAKPGSLHNRGCATDFAGGDPNFVNTPTGRAIIEAATKVGLRINPGTDADQTFHVHVDVGLNNCTAPVLPTSARQ